MDLERCDFEQKSGVREGVLNPFFASCFAPHSPAAVFSPCGVADGCLPLHLNNVALLNNVYGMDLI